MYVVRIRALEKGFWGGKTISERPGCGLDFMELASRTLTTLGLIFLNCQIIGLNSERLSFFNIL